MNFLNGMTENASMEMEIAELPLPQAALRNTVSPAPGHGSSVRKRIVKRQRSLLHQKSANSRKLSESEMKPNNVVVDEMFPEGAGPYMDLDEAGGPTGLLMDLAANEKAVHADFYDEFDDLYDDDDLS